MFNNYQDIFFAVVGDVHGYIYTMIDLLQQWENSSNQQLAFILQVGDFEPHRHEADLATMDAPTKYRKLADFPDFYEQRAIFPWPIWFIGGNHEPYGFLDQFNTGTEITHNCYYLGRVGSLVLAGLKVVGVSGIYQEEKFHFDRPKVSQISSYSNKDYIIFTEAEIIQALGYKSTDILLLHDWPANIINPVDAEEFEQQCRSRCYYDLVGNEYAKMLVYELKPKLVVCSHLHKIYRNKISLTSGNLTDIFCLANVQSGADAIAIFHLSKTGKVTEFTQRKIESRR
ncbi:metallophosphoesterase [Dapis sp. BLCC M126]|uniref:metallophosphoesterase n=1 Tax=Dapis sp. BLCC M126 TaxID=3400189 RepID=UPI003CF033AD